jgi:hypothetical protein
MEAELAQLAASGATSLVGLMATDAWTQVRGRLARFFARGGAGTEEDAVSADLERSRDELTAAREAGDTATAEDVRAEWRLRLRRALQADPAAAGELRRLLAELEPARQDARIVVVNTINGGTYHHAVVQSGFTFYGSAPASQAPAVPPPSPGLPGPPPPAAGERSGPYASGE